MIGVVGDVHRRPERARIGLEPFDVCSEVTVAEKTQDIRHVDRVDQRAVLDIRHPDDCQRRVLPGSEYPLHRRELQRLVLGHVLAVPVAGRIDHEQRENGGHYRSASYETPPEREFALREEVICTDTGDDEPAGNQRAAEHVNVLKPCKRRKKDCDQAGELEVAAGDSIADGVLHPRIRCHDEESRKPRAQPHRDCGSGVERTGYLALSVKQYAEED